MLSDQLVPVQLHPLEGAADSPEACVHRTLVAMGDLTQLAFRGLKKLAATGALTPERQLQFAQEAPGEIYEQLWKLATQTHRTVQDENGRRVKVEDTRSVAERMPGHACPWAISVVRYLAYDKLSKEVKRAQILSADQCKAAVEAELMEAPGSRQSPAEIRQLVERLAAESTRGRSGELSVEECERVIAWLLAGWDQREIARELGRHHNTICNLVARIGARLQVEVIA